MATKTQRAQITVMVVLLVAQKRDWWWPKLRGLSGPRSLTMPLFPLPGAASSINRQMPSAWNFTGRVGYKPPPEMIAEQVNANTAEILVFLLRSN